MASTLRYFDYLADHGEALEDRIGFDGLEDKINVWRQQGTADPDSVVVGCRKIAENIVDHLIDDREMGRANLAAKISYALNGGLVDKTLFYKLEEIRKKGNRGAHGSETVKVIDAKMCLELLDDVLRALIVDLGIDPDAARTARITDDSLFLIRSEAEMADLRHTARTAALLSGDPSIEKEARRATAAIQKQEKEQATRLDALSDLIKQVEEIEAECGIAEEGTDEQTAREQIFARTDAILDIIRRDARETEETAIKVERHAREILSEHDFVEKLLQGRGRATSRQFDVMAFPRSANAKTNILQLAGGAGTGKTLCLIAKLIADTKASDQTSLFAEKRRKGLFVCYNKGLAKHVRDLIARFPEAAASIEVTHYDEYVNQLVRVFPKEGYEHLIDYARDARYPREGRPGNYRYWELIFEGKALPLVGRAMATVAERHPKDSGSYYLDRSASENIAWVYEELDWLEARYDDPSDARRDYPTSSRIGRGTKRRPNEAIRMVLLEIWETYRRLLEEERRYTIAQATKRLQSSKSLPAYDVIAIDEVQDFSIRSIKLLLQLRADEQSRVYLSGDENQKIYRGDFTWKELDSSLRGHTIVLTENKRSSEAIEAFASRLLAEERTYGGTYERVFVLNATDEKILRVIGRLRSEASDESVAVIGNAQHWERLARAAKFDPRDPRDVTIFDPRLYVLGMKAGKGLEFDNVIIDYTRPAEEDEDAEMRLLYTNCTRARKRLYIRYRGEPPDLLKKVYPDFID